MYRCDLHGTFNIYMTVSTDEVFVFFDEADELIAQEIPPGALRGSL